MEITITIKDDPRGGAHVHIDYGRPEDDRPDSKALRLVAMVTALMEKAAPITKPLNLKPTKESHHE